MEVEDQMPRSTGNSSPSQRNRLADSASPYLLQHADNPVHWYPWGEDAFAAARELDKPVFLSIGYATCHWCHVMAHESFEDPEVAALMNEAFVNIKVDREERPDIDQVYMTVCQMLTGSGGWPLTIIMTPDREPFFAGTYLPRSSRSGRLGMLELVPRVQEIWSSDRQSILATTRQVLAGLQKISGRRSSGDIGPEALKRGFQDLAGRFDAARGGFGSAPKFPTPHNLLFLLRFWRTSGNRLALDMVARTLEAMRLGGIYDQVGFGFHRYSTDAHWLVPHFEKMLYDQAMLMLAYTEAARATRQPLFERTVQEIATYVMRDMTSPDGGFYSAEDADSEGEEGRFYLWARSELHEILGAEDADFAAEIWRASERGNFADEATGRRNGRNILHLECELQTLAAASGAELEAFEARVESIRERLFAVRERRVHPLKDDKVLADWNGLMIAALARAGRHFERDDWLEAAEIAAAFVMLRMRDCDGRLQHRSRGGDTAIPAFLDDYAFQTFAMLELYDATLDARYLELAVALQRSVDELFIDRDKGGYFFTPDDGEALLVRHKEYYDGAIPSGNSVVADNLVRLARLTGRPEYEHAASAVFESASVEVQRMPSAHCRMLTAVHRRDTESVEVVVVGAADSGETRKLIAAARRTQSPSMTVLLVEPGESGDVVRDLAPFTSGYSLVDGLPAAYVCRDFSCRAPVTDPTEVERLLRETAEAPTHGDRAQDG